MIYRVSAEIDQGRVREEQQDAIAIIPDILLQQEMVNQAGVYDTVKASVYIVADGMGGAASGDMASRLAVNSLKHYFSAQQGLDLMDPRKLVSDAALYANHFILKYVSEHPAHKGMGSTLVLVLLYEGAMHLCWVGDSRCYGVKRTGGFRQLTRDHSFVQQLIDEGQLSSEAAIDHPNRNIITRSLGMEELEPDYACIDISDYSHIYLCSDGITTMINDADIYGIIDAHQDVRIANQQLIKAANDAGGYDNISSILISFQTEDKPSGGLPAAAGKPKLLKLIALIALLAGFGIIARNAGLFSATGESSADSMVASDTIAYLPPVTLLTDSTVPNTAGQAVPIADTAGSNTRDSQLLMKDPRKFDYYVRLSVFGSRSQAREAAAKAQKEIIKRKIEVRSLNNGLYETFVNGFASQDLAADFIDAHKLHDAVIIIESQQRQK